MALTVTYGTHGISVVFDGSTAWDSTTIYPNGIRVESLEFKPTATNDVGAVREGGVATGRKIFDVKAATAYDNKLKRFNTEKGRKLYKLYVKGDEMTNGCELIVEFA